MGILDGKNIVITGVLTDASLAFGVAQLAQHEGANIVLTGAGRGLSITQRTARKLEKPAPVVEFDVTVDAHTQSARDEVKQHLGVVDGVLHSIGFALVSATILWRPVGLMSRWRCRYLHTR